MSVDIHTLYTLGKENVDPSNFYIIHNQPDGNNQNTLKLVMTYIVSY